MSAWWRRQSIGARVVIGILVIVIGGNLIISAAGELVGRDPSGPDASSYSTTARGTAALARLYGRAGHRVARLRQPLHGASLDPAATLLVVGPDNLFPRDVTALMAFLDEGGRVIAAGAGVESLVNEAVDLRWGQRGGTHVHVTAGVPEAGRASTLVAGGTGEWRGGGAAKPFLAAGQHVTGVVAAVGGGRLIALADPSILDNGHLGHADNAALALAAVGAGRPVTFDEQAHGYGAGRQGVPHRWVRFLIAATLAVLLWMWVEAKRLGPAEDASRPLAPARREYVDALAVSLSRTREPQAALEKLQRSARQRLALSVGLSADATMTELLGAAGRAGVAAEEVRVLYESPRTADDVVELGRVAARNRGGRL